MRSLITLAGILITVTLSAQSVTMMLINTQVNGNQITYDVSAADFSDMVGMQYAVIYDPDKLSFVSFANFNIPDLDNGDFNPNQPGIIRTVWLQPSLEGVTVDDGTVLYQILFEMQGGDPGDVCFSEDLMEIQFIRDAGDLTSFFIMDDCHPVPYEIPLTTSLEDLGERYGLWINTLASRDAIAFRLDRPQTLSFRIHDMSGKLIRSYDKVRWPAGPHAIYRRDLLIPGMYVLSGEVSGEPFAVQVVCQE